MMTAREVVINEMRHVLDQIARGQPLDRLSRAVVVSSFGTVLAFNDCAPHEADENTHAFERYLANRIAERRPNG